MNEILRPDWPAHPRVQAFITTRAFGDLAQAETRKKLRSLLPGEPVWLQQVHGAVLADADAVRGRPEADASVARKANTVCAVCVADCMPVLLADEAGTVVGVAHAGWRGLCAGVIEATLDGMRAPAHKVLAWLGPAIGPRFYEVGEEVRSAFRGHESAFVAARAGHWRLDLYAVARERLASRGVRRVYGGGFCTFSDAERFFSFRRDRTSERMAALIWLT